MSFFARLLRKSINPIVVQRRWACPQLEATRGQGLVSEPGTLDPTFGAGGKLVTSIQSSVDAAPRCLAVQADGKYIAAGQVLGTSGTRDIALVRYNVDGSLDTGFGTAGEVVTDLGGDEVISGCAIQADGKIVVTGSSGQGQALDDGLEPSLLVVARYTSDGKLDSTFGAAGVVLTNLGVTDDVNNHGTGVAVQSNGQIVVCASLADGFGGGVNNGNFIVVRFNSSGALDSAFGSHGVAMAHLGDNSGASTPFSLAVQLDGKIVVAGETTVTSSYRAGVLRLNADGTLDSTFGNGGIAIIDMVLAPGSDDNSSANHLVIDAEGHILVSGPCFVRDGQGGVTSFFAIARLTPSGQLDATFGNEGLVNSTFDTDATWITVLADGKIVLAGITASPQPGTGVSAIFLDRYTATGQPDSSFGVNGTLATNIIVPSTLSQSFGTFGIFGEFGGLLQDPGDSQIVLAGAFIRNNHSTLGVARLNEDGTLDASFGSGGQTAAPFLNKIYYDSGNIYASASPLSQAAVQPDGKVVVVATAYTAFNVVDGVDSAFTVLRFNSDGSPDTQFGVGGAVTIAAGSFPWANALTFQPDGKIVVAGVANEQILLARLQPDGSLDASFGANGVLMTDLNDANGLSVESVNGVAVRPNGRIVLAGLARGPAPAFPDYFMAIQFNPDGSRDSTFGDQGLVLTSFNQHGHHVAGLVLSSDGRLTVAGSVDVYVAPSYVLELAMVRYNSDGTLDTTFGVGGKVVAPTAINAYINAVVLQSDYKIIVGGDLGGQAVIARFTAAGAYDDSFGSQGQVLVSTGTAVGISALALQPNGQILVGGSAGADSSLVIRLQNDGSLDQTFGANGIAVTPWGSAYSTAVELIPSSSACLVVGMRRTGVSYYADLTLSRILTSEVSTPLASQLHFSVPGL